MNSAENFRPAVSMVAPAKKRHAILELARRAEELKFAGIACPSLGATIGHWPTQQMRSSFGHRFNRFTTATQ
jgi:hypothetical protein